MSLRNIVGQGKAVEILLGILENQKIATSYLFCGEPGIGKKTAAVQFAKALNCLEAEVRLLRRPAEAGSQKSKVRFYSCS